jgi:hypothetical protein
MKQRLRYKDWLHVYAKEQSAVTPRMAELIDDYKVIIICPYASGLLYII